MAYVGRSPKYGFLEGQTATFNGSTTVVTLQRSVSSTDALDVYIDNVHQEPNVAYNLSSGGSAITFTGTPANGQKLYIRFHGISFDTARASKLTNTNADSTLTISDSHTLTLNLNGTTALTATTSGITIPNLTVTGTTTSVNSTQLVVGDNQIILNSDVASGVAPSEDAGIVINRGSSADVAFLWDEGEDYWLAADPIVSSTRLSTIKGGTTPTIASSTVGLFQSSASNQSAALSIIANSGQSSILNFGDENDENAGSLTYSHSADTFALSKGLGITGNIAVSGTVDGVDIAARDSVLTSTTTTANAASTTANAALPKAGGTMTGMLSLQADANARSIRIIGRSDDYGEIDFYENDNSTILARLQTHNTMFNIRAYSVPMNFQQSADTKMTILADGNVGIGIDGPTSKLHVSSTPSSSYATAHILQAGATNLPTLTIEQTGGGGNDNVNQGLLIKVDGQNAGAGNMLRVIGTNNSLNGGTDIDAFVVKTGGNVGVGGSVPLSKMHIFGNGSVRNNLQAALIVDGGVSVANPYTGHGTGINFKGRDYSNAVRNYAAINAVMVGNNSHSTPAGDPGFSSALTFTTNGGGASATNPTERMRISAEGYVTTPYQPAFDAFHTSGSYYSGTTASSLDLNTTRLNRGGHYNTSLDRFIAPVAGVYQFNYRTIINGVYTSGHVRMLKNAVILQGADTHFSPSVSGGWSQVLTQIIVELAVGDYVQVQHIANTLIYGNSYQSFNGHLIG